MRQVKKNIRECVMAIIVTLCVLVVFALNVVAATSATSTFQTYFELSVSSSGEVEITQTETGWTVAAYGTGSDCSAASATVSMTLTNKATASDGTPRGVSFTLTVDGTANNYEWDSSTTSITFTASSGEGKSYCSTITVSITDIEWASLGQNVTTVFIPCEGGTFSVDGTEVQLSTQLTNSDSKEYVLSATAAEGYAFYGWMANSGILNIGSTTYTYAGKDNNTVWPLFVRDDSAVYYVSGGVCYAYLDEAINAAGSSGTIILQRSGSAYGKNGDTFTLNGQTLLLPYAAGANTVATSTAVDTTGNCNSTYIHANAAFTSDYYDNPTYDSNGDRVTYSNGSIVDQSDGSVVGVMDPSDPYLTLTIPTGTTIDVNSGSKVVIGGTIVGGTCNTRGVNGGTAAAHSNLVLNGTLNINSGGILSACGYILGNGTINVQKGGSVYQPFTIMDHRDGHYAANSTGDNTFPFSRYTMNNIQCQTNIVYGGSMYGYIDVFTQPNSTARTEARHNVDCQLIIGTASSGQCLLKLAGDATVSLSYDASSYVECANNNAAGYYSKVGRTIMTISGGASLGNLQISVYVPILGNQTSDSANMVFPVPYNYNIELTNGTYSLDNSLMLLPGAEMTVASDANLIAASGTFIVFDGLRDYAHYGSSVSSGTWYVYHYPSTTDLQNKGTLKSNGTANLIVNGTLTVNSGVSFGGYVQTTGASGKVVMNGTPSATGAIGHIGDLGGLYSYAVNDQAGRTERTLVAKLFDQNGNIIDMESGKTYSAVNGSTRSIASYSYIMYFNASKTSYYYGYGVASSYVDSNDVTQTAQKGNAETLNAQVCGSWCCHSLTLTAAISATCTTDGNIAYYTCSNCGRYYSDEAAKYEMAENTWIIPATGHIDTDADLNCDNCGADMGTSLAKLVAIEASADAEVLLKLKFTINAKLLSDENAYVVMTKYGLETKTVRWTMADLNALEDSKGRYVLSMSIASGEMTCPVTVQIYEGNGDLVSITDYADGSVYTTVSRTVVDYARLALAKGSDEQKKIVTYMLTYGGYAQKYFGVDTDNPAYDVLKEFDIEIPDISGISAETITQTNIFPDESVSIEKSTQIAYLDSAIYLRTYFELDSSGTYAFTLTYPANGQEYTTTMDLEKDDSRYYVDILDIPAAYLDYMYTIEAKNTTTEETFKLQTSVLAYLKLVLSQSNDTKLINLVKSMYLYNQAANEFFSK